MSKKYELVNPYILGSFERKFTAENSLQAAHLAYQSLSQHFVGHIPTFKFTLQRVKAGYQVGGGVMNDYIHFEVFETTKKKSKGIEYAIKLLKTDVKIDNFQQKLLNFVKRKKNNLFTSEESEDSENVKSQHGGLEPALRGGLEPALRGSLEPALSGSLEPALRGSLDPALRGGLDPALRGSLEPALSGSLEPALRGSLEPALRGSLEPALRGGKKYVEDEELDSELEAALYDDDEKPKKKKGKKLYALTGPLKGQDIYPSPISYYRYDPIVYSEYISYIPVFTEQAKPKRMIYDTYVYFGLN